MGVYKRGGNWWIDYYYQGRRKRERVGPSKTQANTVLQKRKIEIAEGKFLDIKREVPINQAVYNALFGMRPYPNSPYIFSTKEGKRYSQSWVQHTFHKIIKKLGIKDFRFHDLRHTFASQLLMMGIGLKTVQELLGHKKIDMTLRYAHLSPDFKKKAVDIFYDRMDTIWSPEKKREESEKTAINEKIDVVKVLEEERSHSPVECGGLLIH